MKIYLLIKLKTRGQILKFGKKHRSINKIFNLKKR